MVSSVPNDVKLRIASSLNEIRPNLTYEDTFSSDLTVMAPIYLQLYQLLVDYSVDNIRQVDYPKCVS